MIRLLKHFVEQSWLLIVSAFVFGLLIAVTYAALKPRIDQNEIDKLNNLMGELIEDANFAELDTKAQVELGKGKVAETTIYKAVSLSQQHVGYCFVAEGPGFADKIKLVIAVDENFEKLFGYRVLATNETPGFGDRIQFDYYMSQFEGAPVAGLRLSRTGDVSQIDDEIVAISGATISSEAVIKIFNNYLAQIESVLKAEGLIGDGE